MSAVAGIYHLNEEPIQIEHSRRMMEDLQKYPANDIQTWLHGPIFFGCHAQWITPESVGERLPYYDPVRQLAITADAMIDNRMELFDQLRIERGQRADMPDSQLILHAYDRWGEETPKHLMGDFVFMIWDGKRRRMFGARDFSGSRTLYFYYKAQRFAFCTLINPLLTLPYIEKQLNEGWLAEFLAIPDMFDTVDAHSTAYHHIEQLPPSHCVIVTMDGIAMSRYCTISQGEKLHLKSDQEYVEAFREVFQRSVSDRLRTHRQVGSQLSGGLDSGSIVAFAAKSLSKENKRLHTYSYVPPDGFVDWTPKYKQADERPSIRSIVKYVGNIREHYIDCEGNDSLSDVDDWLDTMETPYKFFENSFWVKRIYEEAQKKDVGILLNGGRGNFTISWGPALAYYANLLKKLRWARLVQEIVLYSESQGVGKSRVLSVVAKKAFPTIWRIIQRQPEFSFEFPPLISSEFAEKTYVYEKLQQNGINRAGGQFGSIYEIRKRHFEQVFSWNTTGTSGAKMSLRYSMRERDPCNDLRVIRFCLSIPEEQYVKNGLGRALIRRVTNGFLPDDVRLNQRIRGIQGADWVHRMSPRWPAFIGELEEIRSNPDRFRFFNRQTIDNGIAKIRQGPRADHAFDADFRILMRALIVHRFLKQWN